MSRREPEEHADVVRTVVHAMLATPLNVSQTDVSMNIILYLVETVDLNDLRETRAALTIREPISDAFLNAGTNSEINK